MNASADLASLPLWAAIPAAILLVIGATLTLIGSLGLLRLGTFYERIHAPTLGTSGGVAGIVLASAIVVSVLGRRLVLHELLIAVFVTVTTPVTLMLLGRAVLYREQQEAAAKAGEAGDPRGAGAGPPAKSV